MSDLGEVKAKATVSSYQSMDGSNFTTAGYELKYKNAPSVYAGFGTDFSGKSVFVADIKDSHSYGQDGMFGCNARIRTKAGEDCASTQFRVSPFSLNVPVTDKTSLYVNPHYSGTYNYKTQKWTNSAGVFGGVSQKVSDNTTISLEAQRYNLQNIGDNSGKNWSVNAVISINL